MEDSLCQIFAIVGIIGSVLCAVIALVSMYN